MIETVGQIGIPSRDVSRSVAFYRDILRIPLLFEAPRLAFFECGAVRLSIGPPREKISHGATVYFKVGDVHQTAADLQSRGVEFDRQPHLVAKMPDHEIWMAFFHDPDGNPLALMGAIRPPN